MAADRANDEWGGRRGGGPDTVPPPPNCRLLLPRFRPSLCPPSCRAARPTPVVGPSPTCHLRQSDRSLKNAGQPRPLPDLCHHHRFLTGP